MLQIPPDDFVAPVCHQQLSIVYQDEHIVIVNKPSGLLSLSGKNPLNWDSVHYRLVRLFPTARLVHRLDLGTSGLLIVALNKPANGHIGKQFQQKTVKKRYIAMLAGHVPNAAGVIDLPIAKDELNFPLQKICHQTGKAAVSHYELVSYQQTPAVSRVVFTPLSGRTHQLRIHAQAIGHSILGCDLYASAEVTAMSERLMLHASEIAFEHPVTGEWLEFTCEASF